MLKHGLAEVAEKNCQAICKRGAHRRWIGSSAPFRDAIVLLNVGLAERFELLQRIRRAGCCQSPTSD
ncbi:MAG: hypothetical protein EBY76_01000 [Betaproteobacteria bacterium]|nr:hypothetical protein [Betaproteobacteria bacterium]